MTAAREEIFAALDVLLAAVDGVQRYEREPSGDPDVFPALALYDAGDRPKDGEVGIDQKTLAITVQGYVEGGAGAVAHAAMNELHAAVVRAVMSITAPIRAEAIEVRDLRVSVAGLASSRRFGFAQDFDIEFATLRGDPSAFA